MWSRRLAVLVLALLCATASQAQVSPKRLRIVTPPNACVGCVTILTTDNAQTIINANPAGTSFLIASGTHRLDSISPRAGDSYIGENGAILSGAKLLPSASFVVTSGGFWKITGQTQAPGARVGTCQLTLTDNPSGQVPWATSYPGCDYPEELFRDGERMVHVTSTAALAPGTWYFDYPADEIYLGDNPAGHVIETSVTTYAFTNTANNVTIRNLTIEKYASPAQYGCINSETTSGWVVTDNTLQKCHSGGIRIGNTQQILRNVVYNNGEIGLVGIGTGTRVEDNTVSYNNGAHFDPGWEGGGTKFVLTDGLIVQGNWFHHNEGPGLWLDIDNINYTVSNNVVEDNQQMGIFTEISYAGVIRNNTVSRNGLAYWVPNYIWGVGILVAASPNVEVYGNTLTGNRGGIAGIQQSRGSGTYGAHLITNLYVHDNTVTLTQASGSPVWNGLADDTGSSTIFTTDNNRFRNNTYFCQTDLNYFVWANTGYLSFSAWQGYGHDVASGSSIAFDSATVGASISATSQTTPFTVSGAADRFLLVGVLGDATSDVITGVTYNGAAMTLVDKQNAAPGSVYWQYLFRLIAPASGAHSIVVSASTTTQISTFAASYSGVLQTGQPSAQSEQAGTGNPYAMTLTTTAAGSWTAAFVNASVGLVDGTGFTTRIADDAPVYAASLGDSATPIVVAGSTSLAVNGGGGQKQSEMVAFAPITAGIGGSATVF